MLGVLVCAVLVVVPFHYSDCTPCCYGMFARGDDYFVCAGVWCVAICVCACALLCCVVGGVMLCCVM